MNDLSRYLIQAAMKILAVFILSMCIASQVSAAMICGFNDTAGKLNGISGACRTTPQDGEYDAGSSQYFFEKNLNFSCPNQSCMLKQGNELCAAVAKLEARVGTYTCTADTSACASAPLSQVNGTIGGFVCTGNQVCCSAKSTVDATTSGSSGSGSGGASSVSVPDPLGGATIPGLIGNIIKTFAGIAGSIALVIFVMGGFFYILSGGDAGKVKNATAMLRNGAIGIILIFGAYFFTATIINAILVQNK